MYVTQKRIFVVFVFKTTCLKNKIKSTLINQFVYRRQAIKKEERLFSLQVNVMQLMGTPIEITITGPEGDFFENKFLSFKSGSKLQTSITKKLSGLCTVNLTSKWTILANY